MVLRPHALPGSNPLAKHRWPVFLMLLVMASSTPLTASAQISAIDQREIDYQKSKQQLLAKEFQSTSRTMWRLSTRPADVGLGGVAAVGLQSAGVGRLETILSCRPSKTAGSHPEVNIEFRFTAGDFTASANPKTAAVCASQLVFEGRARLNENSENELFCRNKERANIAAPTQIAIQVMGGEFVRQFGDRRQVLYGITYELPMTFGRAVVQIPSIEPDLERFRAACRPQ